MSANEASGGRLSGRRIVVVGIYYAPDTTGIAPYTTHLCETLAAEGAQIDAVVGIPHYPGWRADSRYRRSLVTRETRAGVRLHRARHFVPRHQNAVRRAMYEGTFAVSSWLAARRLVADLVIAVTPALGALPSAASVARRCHAPLGVIVQDLVGQAASQAGVQGGTAVASVVSRLEGRYLTAAQSVAVISQTFRTELERMGLSPSRIQHLPNFSHIRAATASAAEARGELGWPLEKFLVVHTGNMGHKQDLQSVLAAAALAQDSQPDIEFVFVGDGSARPALCAEAASLTNVRFVSPLTAERYPLALAAADCLLVNELPSVTDMSLPSKLTSYFAAGRPVLAAVNRGGATADELTRSGAGLRVDPGRPSELLLGVVQIRADPVLASSMSSAGRRFADDELSPAAATDRLVHFALQTLKAGTGVSS